MYSCALCIRFTHIDVLIYLHIPIKTSRNTPSSHVPIPLVPTCWNDEKNGAPHCESATPWRPHRSWWSTVPHRDTGKKSDYCMPKSLHRNKWFIWNRDCHNKWLTNELVRKKRILTYTNELVLHKDNKRILHGMFSYLPLCMYMCLFVWT